VIKKNGNKEVYSRENLSAGIYKACQKRPIEEPVIEKTIDDLEKELKGCSENEVKSSKIGNLVMDKLLGLDDVAYMRFASVYKSFKDVDSFVKELNELKTTEN
jgi:transcriptional repressor NrdR